MGDAQDFRDTLNATRGQVKAAMRTLRATSQVLADLEERLTALETARPEEGEANGKYENTRHGRSKLTV